MSNKMKNMAFRKLLGIVAALMLTVIFSTSCTTTNKNNSISVTDKGNVVAGEGVVIVKSEISETAKFYPYTADDGIEMELLAFKASDGTIRTAFNTCQICYDSGRGYYVQEGNVLVCQNCGNRFLAEKVGIEVGGCNPIPVMDTDRTEDDETITISNDFINRYVEYFGRWK